MCLSYSSLHNWHCTFSKKRLILYVILYIYVWCTKGKTVNLYKNIKIAILIGGILLMAFGISACGKRGTDENVFPSQDVQWDTAVPDSSNDTDKGTPELQMDDFYVTEGSETYREFVLDNILHTEEQGDIHFNLYVPESYDGNTPFALFITLPGYEGLYFQGVGQNLKSEAFAFEAQEYNQEMIILAPQLSDWGETSADQTILLTEYYIENYNIDPDRVYLHGMSGGGETGSIVMGKRPELYAAYLATSTCWDGDLEVLAQARTPVYMAIGDEDSYYGSEPLTEAYQQLYSTYRDMGLTEREIDDILVLDIRSQEFFSEYGFQDQHAGGQAFAYDSRAMGWLFSW